MIWLATILVLIVFVFFMCVNETFRAVGCGIILLIAIILCALFGYFYFENKKTKEHNEKEKNAIPHNRVIITNETLSFPPGLWIIEGDVYNQSLHEIRSFTLNIRTYDCRYYSRRPKHCTINGEDNITIYKSVPSGQKRRFSAYPNLPSEITFSYGSEWDYTIKEVTADLNKYRPPIVTN